jgi:hypothetical protein
MQNFLAPESRAADVSGHVYNVKLIEGMRGYFTTILMPENALFLRLTQRHLEWSAFIYADTAAMENEQYAHIY